MVDDAARGKRSEVENSNCLPNFPCWLIKQTLDSHNGVGTKEDMVPHLGLPRTSGNIPTGNTQADRGDTPSSLNVCGLVSMIHELLLLFEGSGEFSTVAVGNNVNL